MMVVINVALVAFTHHGENKTHPAIVVWVGMRQFERKRGLLS
jgi:hypothetical protein